jgi:hypothetical protein
VQLQVKQSVGLALFSIFLAGLPSVLGVLPLWLTVCSLLNGHIFVKVLKFYSHFIFLESNCMKTHH